MWMTLLIWFLVIGSICLWAYNFTYFKHRDIYAWFDNKYGKDDPMPPMPNQPRTKPPSKPS